MERYRQETADIPWSSMGRETIASRIGRSLLPIGILPYDAPAYDPFKPALTIASDQEGFENYLMDIVGTAIQAGDGKLVTCGHVIEAVMDRKRKGYVLSRAFRGSTVICSKRPFERAFRYIDPRSGNVNKHVDLALIPFPAVSTPEFPYEVPIVEWGQSSQLGVGDDVIVGGYPYGTDLFRTLQSNRAVIQPTFFKGIISAIIPATNETETRILQISVSVAGGISGGAVFDPITGAVLGMIMSGITGKGGALHPVTYALPSEVIAPYVRAINYKAGGRHWQ